ncbi:Nrap protein [Stachybotrys elegans]|uniref:U3 small nucleolar RNA-associated protein 22 n=1 Tax=Stachybotrys elegans TaxID=80388 RepID=A0A8K0WUV0_9HYPO|nr:Nrap protein [Stachybotrys elegans]
MESSSKRRKIDHESGTGPRQNGLIDFESRFSARVSAASTFILQTEELLKEARLDYAKALKDVDGQLHRIKSAVDAIPSHEPALIAEATAKFEKQHRIVIPYPNPRPAADSPYKVSYEKPTQCNVVGSYVSKTMVKTQPSFAIDMVVQMPRSLFQDKDYQNLRYFYRRAYYIAYISAHVRKELGDSMAFSFEHLHENPLLPVLVMRPKAAADGTNKSPKKSTKKVEYAIRLIPCAPEDLFPRAKLAANVNCNRQAEVDSKKSDKAVTPFYNSTLLAEGTFISYLRILAHAKSECAAFTEACVLGRIWLQQRGYGSAISQGGFGHFEWAIMVALLLQTGGRNGQPLFSNSLSSSELFKAAIQFLSTTDFNKKPFKIGVSSSDIDTIREAGPVLHDSARGLNLLFKMSPWSAALLQSHAKSTMALLADEAAEKFEPIFIIKADSSLQLFDAVLSIKTSSLAPPASPDQRGLVWDWCLEAYKILKKAYGNRAQLVHLHLPSKASWSLGGSPGTASGDLTVGVVFDYGHMSRQMEHGPPAEEQKDAARFRQFWGEKAELRRFKDGSILECVEWSSKQPSQICEEIARYILGRHLKLPKEDISSTGYDISPILTLSHADKEAFDAARRAFQTLEYDIRNLEELPLQIRQLAPVSPLARYASIEPPLIGFHNDVLQPMDVNLYFEASSKWPENLVAIQAAKVEFLLDFDRRLTAAHDNITTYLGRDDVDVGIENMAYLDIVYDSGAAFRLRIRCDMEQTLLERQAQNKTLDHHVRAAAEEVLTTFNWQFTTLPLHNQTVATFCTRLLPLSPTIRLVKQWFHSHKLGGHFSEELVELFVLHVFLQPYPWKMPSSPLMGLARTLDFLSRWDWRDEPLVVDSAETLTPADRAAVHKELEAWRKRDPLMNTTVLLVATSHDPSGHAYTQAGRPSKLIASRMTRLAKAACKLLKDHDFRLDPELLFQSSLHDYDVLFHLSPKAVRAILRDAATETGARKPSQFKNLDDLTGKAPLPIRAHPVNVLVEELQRVYNDTLIFFRGTNDDNVIGAIWNPRLQQQRFRPGLLYNFHSVDDEDDKVEVNREAILLEIARIGGELIKKIEQQE